VIAMLAAAAMATAGCGGDDPAAPAEAGADTTTEERAEDSERASGDVAINADPLPRTGLEAQDGFNGPLDVEADHEAGAGTVTFNGESHEVAVECRLTSTTDRPFDFTAFIPRDDAGTELDVSADRRIYAERNIEFNHDRQEYGTFMVGWRQDGSTATVSFARSPSDSSNSHAGNEDPEGALLPIVRVLDDGRFSAVADMNPPIRHPDGITAEGLTVFTGRCPAEGWPGADL
jgi:hypothetical protein